MTDPITIEWLREMAEKYQIKTGYTNILPFLDYIQEQLEKK